MWGTDHSFTADQIDQLDFAMSRTAIISLLCSLCIVGTYVLFPRLRKRSSELIVYMSIATIGANITILTLLRPSQGTGSAACAAFGFFSVFFYVAEAMWATIIGHTLSLVLVQRNKLISQIGQSDGRIDMRRTRVLRFHVIAWGTAFVCAIIPAATGYFNLDNDWCWYDGNVGSSGSNGNLMEIFTYVLPLGIAVLYCLAIFCSVMWNMRHIKESALRTRDPLNIMLYELTHKLKFYPVVVMITEGYNVCLKIVTYANPDADLFYYFMVLAILLQSQGTLYFAAYFVQPKVRMAWFEQIFGEEQSDSMLTWLCCLPPVVVGPGGEASSSVLDRLPDLLHLENASTMSQSQTTSRVNSQDYTAGSRNMSSTLRTYQRSISGENSADGSVGSLSSLASTGNPLNVNSTTGGGTPFGLPSSVSRTSLNLENGNDVNA